MDSVIPRQASFYSFSMYFFILLACFNIMLTMLYLQCGIL